MLLRLGVILSSFELCVAECDEPIAALLRQLDANCVLQLLRGELVVRRLVDDLVADTERLVDLSSSGAAEEEAPDEVLLRDAFGGVLEAELLDDWGCLALCHSIPFSPIASYWMLFTPSTPKLG